MIHLEGVSAFSVDMIGSTARSKLYTTRYLYVSMKYFASTELLMIDLNLL